MKHFETREAARILDLKEGRIRSCVRAGFLSPGRGPGRRYRFTFQDLLLLKTTKGLLESGVPPKRVARLMGSLRRQLPEERKLSSVTIYADGRRVVAWDGSARWEPASGQFLFDFDAADVAARAREVGAPDPESSPPTSRPRSSDIADPPTATPPQRRPSMGDRTQALPMPKRRSGAAAPTTSKPRVPATSAPTADDWFELACELEESSAAEARHAYARAIALDPDLADAHVNLGRLLHDSGKHAEAEAHYREAARAAPADPVAWFNLGVLHEDRGRPEEAIADYRRAIAIDAGYADAHFNLGLLYEALGRRAEAMNHYMKAHRLLGRS